MRLATILAFVALLAAPAFAQTTTTYGYDDLGRLRVVTQGSATPVYYNYDSSDNRTKVTNASGGWNAAPVFTPGVGYIYDLGYIASSQEIYTYYNCIEVFSAFHDPDEQTLTITAVYGTDAGIHWTGQAVCFNTAGETISFVVSDGAGGTATGYIVVDVYDLG